MPFCVEPANNWYELVPEFVAEVLVLTVQETELIVATLGTSIELNK